ncbi:MAG: hypothetical protein PHR28_01550 [candidate division Zixibacteria bacterium]|nr:hypothetical protein [candidate division Zixibacteria bacterium]
MDTIPTALADTGKYVLHDLRDAPEFLQGRVTPNFMTTRRSCSVL